MDISDFLFFYFLITLNFFSFDIFIRPRIITWSNIFFVSKDNILCCEIPFEDALEFICNGKNYGVECFMFVSSFITSQYGSCLSNLFNFLFSFIAQEQIISTIVDVIISPFSYVCFAQE